MRQEEASEALEHLCLTFWNASSWNPAAILKGILGYLDVEWKTRGKKATQGRTEVPQLIVITEVPDPKRETLSKRGWQSALEV